MSERKRRTGTALVAMTSASAPVNAPLSAATSPLLMSALKMAASARPMPDSVERDCGACSRRVSTGSVAASRTRVEEGSVPMGPVGQ